jgi:hypothetical protein
MNANTRTTIDTVKSVVSKNNAVSGKQKQQQTQPGGPTIGGVAGIGKQKLVTRPMSSRTATTAKASHTGPTSHGLGEGKESEATANMRLSQTARMKMLRPDLTHHKKPVSNDYFSHMADKATKKPAIKENVAMSVGSGAAVPSITDPTTNYAMEKDKRRKRLDQKIKHKVADNYARRKRPE